MKLVPNNFIGFPYHNSVCHANIIFTWLPYYIVPILSEPHPFLSKRPHTTDRALMFAFFPKPFEDYKKKVIALILNDI